MPRYWLNVHTTESIEISRSRNFDLDGWSRAMLGKAKRIQDGDKIVHYVLRIGRFAAVSKVTSGLFEDHSVVWPPRGNEVWPYRVHSEPEIVLPDERLLDVRALVGRLSFTRGLPNWGVAFKSGLREIPEEDFGLIESEMRKLVSAPEHPTTFVTEQEAIASIEALPLEAKSLHDRLCEMLRTVGTRQGMNAHSPYRIHHLADRRLDVAWLRVTNPAVAIEVHIGGNLTEAIDHLREAKKFNYQKLVMVIKQDDVQALQNRLRTDDFLRPWIEPWSIAAVYRLYVRGIEFLVLWDKFLQSTYNEQPPGLVQ